MFEGEQNGTPNAAPEAGPAFAERPFVPAVPASALTPSRSRRLVAPVLIGLLVVGTVLAYVSRPTNRVEPNAPRVVVTVDGMHCAIQCGLRVESALETLPWVAPDSITVNTKDGIVTFAVTDPESVRENDVRRVIERAGFRVNSVALPAAPSRPN
jgi:hypothetical protein